MQSLGESLFFDATLKKDNQRKRDFSHFFKDPGHIFLCGVKLKKAEVTGNPIALSENNIQLEYIASSSLWNISSRLRLRQTLWNIYFVNCLLSLFSYLKTVVSASLELSTFDWSQYLRFHFFYSLTSGIQDWHEYSKIMKLDIVINTCNPSIWVLRSEDRLASLVCRTRSCISN